MKNTKNQQNVKDIQKVKARKKRAEREELIFIDTDNIEFDSSNETPEALAKQQKTIITSDTEDKDYEINDEMALFAGMNSPEDALYEDLEYQDDTEDLHPAEVAARYQSTLKESSFTEGSDEQILKDLRKLVFSVPLLHQKEVVKVLSQIDQCIFPTVYTILENSMVYLEEVLQIVVKVAAGNTYGKNIYEKVAKPKNLILEQEDDIECLENDRKDIAHHFKESPRKIVKDKERSTYKKHEIKFLRNSYNLFRLYANNAMQLKDKTPVHPIKVSVQQAIKDCAFIRGIYEDILHNFVDNTKYYEKFHWMALHAKVNNDFENYSRYTSIILHLDEKLKLNKSGFYIAREANRIYSRYMELRAKIITPYLRSVYSIAKNTARNSHQMLDNFQNGSIGLLRAVSCYSVKRLGSFASVAKWWITQAMLLSIKEDANFVKLPVSTWQAYTQLEKVKNKDGLADDDIESIAKAAKMPVKKAKAVYQTVKISQVFSLNRTYDAEEKLTLEDIMTDEDKLGGIIDPFTTLLREYCHDADLSELELKVLALRYGMIDLIMPKPQDMDNCIKEAVIQNLAALGYNYKFF